MRGMRGSTSGRYLLTTISGFRSSLLRGSTGVSHVFQRTINSPSASFKVGWYVVLGPYSAIRSLSLRQRFKMEIETLDRASSGHYFA